MNKVEACLFYAQAGGEQGATWTLAGDQQEAMALVGGVTDDLV